MQLPLLGDADNASYDSRRNHIGRLLCVLTRMLEEKFEALP